MQQECQAVGGEKALTNQHWVDIFPSKEVLGHTHTLLASYRWSHSTQIGITGQMEYCRNILLLLPRIGRAQSSPKGEVLRHQLRSEDTNQQVGQCSTTMIRDGREILLNADATRAQDMRVTLIALTIYRLLYGEALDQ